MAAPIGRASRGESANFVLMRSTLPFVFSVLVAVGFAACGDGGADTATAASSASSDVSSSSAVGGTAGHGGALTTHSAGGSGGTGGQGGEHASSSVATGAGGAGGGCQNLLPAVTEPPAKLSETGLYADITTKKVAAYARAYAPQFSLWADDAKKQRHVYLPECGTIDTTDMDGWQFPVGTRAWKEFSLGGKRLETRMMVRYGSATKDILYATYQWDEEQTDATLVVGGAKNVLGTAHDIPDELGCRRCHGPYPAKGGLPSRFLGLDALQLSHDGPGLTLASLIAEGLLSSPPAGNFIVPGTAIEREALGYLHANCGSCHNDTSEGLLFPSFDARVKTTDADVVSTGAYKTMVNQPTQLFVGFGCNYRLAGGSTANSCSYVRMTERGTDMAPNLKQMPPTGTEVIDVTGTAALGAWIAILPPPP